MMAQLAADENLLTLEEVAERLRCSKAAVYRWVQQKDLRAIRVGSRLRFRSVDIEAFLARCDDQAAERTTARRGF